MRVAKLTDEAFWYAAQRWREFATAQLIADEIQEIYGIKVHRQAIQNHAARNRNHFPARTPAQKRQMISDGMLKVKSDPWGSATPRKRKSPNVSDADPWG